MSIQLQIVLPVIVTVVALAVIAILRKYKKAEAVILPLVLALFVAFTLMVKTSDRKAIQQEPPSGREKEVALAVVRQYMLDGNYTQASALLVELRSDYTEDTEVQKALARCAALQGNYATASRLYQGIPGVAVELQLVQQAQEAASTNDNVVISKLLYEGRDPNDYGLTKVTVNLQQSVENVKQTITDAIAEENERKNTEDDSIAESAQAANVLNNSYDRWENGEGYIESEVDSAVTTLEESMDYDTSLRTSRTLRLALMRGYVVLGRFSRVAALADKYCQSEELILLVDLYVNGKITEEDFSEAFMQVDSREWDRLCEICENILAKLEGKLSEEVYAHYYEQVMRMLAQAESPALFAIRTMLMEEAEKGNRTVQSMCWLALSKLECYCQNNLLMSQYFNKALNTASDSNDPMYRQAADWILGILRGTADSEEIKQLKDFISQLIEHASPIQSGSNSSGEFDKEFRAQVEQDVSQSTAKINIGLITVENKNPVTVSARVQIRSDKYITVDQIREHLRVVDCGSNISEFELTPIEYKNSRIILLCDVSGSMSDSISDLKNAVITFAEKMEEGEEVCVIAFDDRITYTSPFSGDPETVKSFADHLYSGGGTALFKSLVECGQYLQRDPVTNNVIIAMTDGQDGKMADRAEIYEKVGAMVGEKDITVYTLGLGDGVDTEYLQTIAECGNGDSLYIGSNDQLESFYDFIHGQLRHQYILRYTAKNQSQNRRTLKLYLEEESGEETKTYYLEDPSFSAEGEDSYVPFTTVDDDLTVMGLSVKFLYKSGKEQYLNLKGTGFDAGDDVTIRLCGNVQYELNFEYVDANTYKVTIPGDIASGHYDLEVNIRDINFNLDDELTIAVPGTEKSYSFGDYNFTALNAYDDNGTLVLSGNVTMNGWLYFKGDVTISGDYQGASWVTMTDNSGAYVSYNEASAHGLAASLAKSGISVPLGKLGDVRLSSDYYDPNSWKNFTTYDFNSLSVLNFKSVVVTDASMSLYPDMVRLEAPEIKLNLPFQKQLLQGLDMELETDADLILSATAIDLYGQLKYSSDDSILMAALPLKIMETEVEVDTMHEDYYIKAIAGLKSLPNMEYGLGLSFGVKGGRFDSLGLHSKGKIRLMDAPVPIALSDLSVEYSDFSEWESDDTLLDKLLKTERTFGFNIEVASMDAYLPQVCKVLNLKDVSLAALKNCEIKTKLSEFRITFETDLEYFGFLDYGHCKASIGHYEYTNQLIGYDREDQYGITIASTKGPDFEAGELKLYAQGTQEITLGYPYSGYWLNGKAGYSVGWWIIRADEEISGDALLGVYKNSAGNLQFSAIVRGTDTDGKYNGFHLYITEATGLQINTY